MRDNIYIHRWDRSLQNIIASAEAIATEESLVILTETKTVCYKQVIDSMSSDWNDSYLELINWCIDNGFTAGKEVSKISMELPLSKDNVKFMEHAV